MNRNLQRDLEAQGRYNRFLMLFFEVVAIAKGVVVKNAGEIDVTQITPRKRRLQRPMSVRNTIIVEADRGQREDDVAVYIAHLEERLQINPCGVV